ncbi:PAS domain-containing protein [Aureimonas fodinaquatilis]|uniref:Blue-light-activated histidine kinase n=1 Tax=Aureimonas fodinaquatilis TaxID=2565783 RepID=A0A5B0E2K7_9HYPH|nr:PAS domain-containing sensor histidine kinase [Aureimonas fodinaquatilis]KAA0972562.1 PAS domain-containing protein [Aureimonas fodinaquatilis]
MNRLDFAQLFAALPSPHLVLDTNMRVAAANPAYEAATGRSSTDLAGMDFFEAFPGRGAAVRQIRNSFLTVVSTGQPDRIHSILYPIAEAGEPRMEAAERYWRVVHTPLFDAAGQLAFVLHSVTDLTEITHLRAAVTVPFSNLLPDADARPDDALLGSGGVERRKDADFRRYFQQAPAMVAAFQGASHVFTFANDTLVKYLAGRELVGRTLAQAIPELTSMGLEAEFNRVYQTGQPFHIGGLNIPLQLSEDGSHVDRYVDISLHPIRDSTGEIIGTFGQATDQTDAIQASRRQRLLLDELNHRVKNTLSAVQSIGRQCLFGGKPPEEARRNFDSRIRALSIAHDVLSERYWQQVEFQVVVERELSAFNSNSIVLDGPKILLDPNEAIAIALIFHELGANAAKYGSLAQPNGSLHVVWSEDKAVPNRLNVEWRETGGLEQNVSAEPGFGLRMLRRIVEGELSGQVDFEFNAAGFTCLMNFLIEQQARKPDGSVG